MHFDNVQGDTFGKICLECAGGTIKQIKNLGSDDDQNANDFLNVLFKKLTFFMKTKFEITLKTKFHVDNTVV